MAVIEKIERVSRAIHKEAVIAHIRLSDPQQMLRAINSVVLGGLNIVELPATCTKWGDVLRKVREDFGNEVTIGISGILDRRTALTAIQTGADYVSSPHTERGIVELCKEEGTIVMQGGLTPNEIFRAQQTGADFISLLPGQVLGAPYVESIIATYGDVPLIPFGGIDDQIAMQFLNAGARAVVVDIWLVNDTLVGRRQFDEIQSRSAKLKKLPKRQRAAR